MSAYDAAALSFDRHRALPDGVPQAIRAAVLAAIETPSPRLLDLGAGSGRIGWPFVAAGDDYFSIDLSLGMLREFARRGGQDGRPRLAQADGERLPFPDATFDAVLLINVFGGMRGWRRVLHQASRVLRPDGALVIGRTVAPADGVDARMKQQLAHILAERGIEAGAPNVREGVQGVLASAAASHTHVIAASWSAERGPRGFLDRHRTGARFSRLPEPVKEEALHRLAAWAGTTFGSLDTTFSEPHAFELDVFQFPQEVDR